MKGNINIHRIIFSITLTLLVACSTNNKIKTKETSTESIIVNKIRSEVFVELFIDDLHPCGTGGQMMDEIKMLYFGFNYFYEISIDEARKLLLMAAKVALNKINNCDEIRPYLANYPFKPINVKIDIFLRNSDYTPFDCEKLQVISFHEGKLEYMNHNSVNNFLTTIHKETYEEALAKIGNVSNIQ